MWLAQCCLMMLVLASRAAYYHVPSMTTLQPPAPLQNDSFFGYSITYHSKSLIVSAPRADLSGQVFSCGLDGGARKCSQMNIPMDELPRYNAYDRKTHNHNFWLGATVKSSKDNLFVCAPRSTDNIAKKYPLGETYFGTSGICYVKNSAEGNFNKLPQIKTEDRYPKFTKYLNENLTDSFGWSIDVEEDASKAWVRVGSPALAAGRVMTYTDTSGAIVPEVFRRSKINEEGFNFGYSIASGNFFKNLKHGVAVGTPYGDNGVGMVLFYADQNILQHEVLDPTGKVGSLFGASLCAAIVRRQTVLLVGAPAYFKDKSYHTGIVYVYKLERNDMTVATKIEGPNKHGAFFGYAIANAGDMDLDKKDEIAIAAPYEDEGRGAVYLYSGSSLEKEGKDLKWLQRFQPKTPEFWNLGLSLTADKYSDHGCYDLAVGAPGNDKVAVYHCLTVITVKINTKFPKLQERTDKTKFKFDLCLNGRYPLKPKSIQAKFTVRVKITHPNATLTNAKSSQDYEEYYETLDKNSSPKSCRQIHVTTVENGDYEQEIQFNIKAELQDDPVLSTTFNPSRATLSSDSVLTANPSISAADCQSGTCKPNLTVGLTTSMKPKYVIGSSETEMINLVVNNGEGDTAYRPCVRVTVGGDGKVTIHRAPPECQIDNDHTAVCRLQRPLKKNNSWNVSKTQNIELGLTSLTSKNRVVKVSAEVFNRCIMEKADHVATISSELITDSSSVRIENKTDEGEIVFFNAIDVATGRTIHHTYTIINTAGTNWLDLHCNIQLYMQRYIKYNAPIEIYSGDTQRASCELPKLTDSSAGFHSVSCPIADLYAKKTIVVVIPITIVPGALEEVFKKSNGTVETALKVQFETDEHGKKSAYVIGEWLQGRRFRSLSNVSYSTALVMATSIIVNFQSKETSTLINSGAEVPIWIMIAAAAVGLLILLLIGFALYECGFLRRQNKEKLESLQKEVKRKSMILQRQSMRLSSSARAVLQNHTYRELLDAAELKEIEEGVEAKEGEEADNGTNVKRVRKGSKLPLITEAGLNGNSSVSNQDLRAQIEKSLQNQKPTPNPRNLGPKPKNDQPLCDEKEI